MILTRELILAAQTANGGFMKAQVEFLGLNLTEKWIGDAIGVKLSDTEYARFIEYRNVDAEKLKKLKKLGDFDPIQHSKEVTEKIAYDLTQKGVDTGINYKDGLSILVGDIVEFEWNEAVGKVKAEVRFVAPSFVGVIIEHTYPHDILGAKTTVSSLWTKIN